MTGLIAKASGHARVVALIVGLIVGLEPLGASACMCTETSRAELCARHQGVLLTGRVESVRPNAGEWEVRVRVWRSHRGPASGSIFVFRTGRVPPGGLAVAELTSCDGPPPPAVGAWVLVSVIDGVRASACDLIEVLPNRRAARRQPCGT